MRCAAGSAQTRRCTTADIPLPGARDGIRRRTGCRGCSGVSARAVWHPRAGRSWRSHASAAGLDRQLSPSYPDIAAQVVFARSIRALPAAVGLHPSADAARRVDGSRVGRGAARGGPDGRRARVVVRAGLGGARYLPPRHRVHASVHGGQLMAPAAKTVSCSRDAGSRNAAPSYPWLPCNVRSSTCRILRWERPCRNNRGGRTAEAGS